MAFVGSLTMENSVLLQSRNNGRPMYPLFRYRLQNSLGSAGPNGSTFRYAKVVAGASLCCKRMTGECGITRPRRIKRQKAVGKGSGEIDDGDEPEDALEATIEKSKKVLAMQRDLLQRIAERRKLVSSTKNSIIDPESDEVSYEERKSSFLSLGRTSDGGKDTNEDHTSRVLYSSNDNLTINDARKTLPPPIRKDFGEGAKEPEKDLSHEKTSSDVDSHRQLRDTISETAWYDELPSFLSSSSATSSLKDEKHEDLKESSLNEVNIEVDMPTKEDEKPPPSAGANVMNVILVAAECAPWSKTGGLGDVAGALPKALARRGHRVMVVAPRYGNYAEPQDTGVRKTYKVDGQDVEMLYFQAYIDGVDFVFMDSHMFRHIENIYMEEIVWIF